MDAHNLQRQMKQLFTEHPHGTGESYLEHLWFTVKMATRFAGCGGLLLIHGLFPFLFTHAVSRQLDGINRIFARRTSQSDTARAEGDRPHLGWDV